MNITRTYQLPLHPSEEIIVMGMELTLIIT